MSSRWEAEARNRGYDTEKAMWEDLYSKYSLTQIAKMFAPSGKTTCGINTIRERVAKAGIQIKPRGGANNLKVEITDALIQDVVTLGVRKAAEKHGITPQTLYNRVYYKTGLRIRDLKQSVAESLRAQGEGDPPSSISHPKGDHEPQP